MKHPIDISIQGHHIIKADNLDETHAIGIGIGSVLTSKAIITLDGDLGSGKTSFVQGLAKGLSVPENYYITSPTYNIINEYPGRHTLYHMDLYRISNPEELYDIGLDEIIEDEGIIAIEWPDRLPEGWLTPNIEINIEITPGDTRRFTISIN